MQEAAYTCFAVNQTVGKAGSSRVLTHRMDPCSVRCRIPYNNFCCLFLNAVLTTSDEGKWDSASSLTTVFHSRLWETQGCLQRLSHAGFPQKYRLIKL